jgi:hypothetical protein
MNAVASVTLEAPAKNYGAVLGKKYFPLSAYRWMVFAAVLLIATIVSPAETFLFIPSDEKGYGVMWLINGFLLILAAAAIADSRHTNLVDFDNDFKKGKWGYVNTFAREYIETRYGVKFRANEFSELWRGWNQYVQVNGEYKKVCLQGTESITAFARGNSRFYPEDLILVEVIEPAKVSYKQLPTVV